jgi:hypothetical protein
VGAGGGVGERDVKGGGEGGKLVIGRVRRSPTSARIILLYLSKQKLRRKNMIVM